MFRWIWVRTSFLCCLLAGLLFASIAGAQATEPSDDTAQNAAIQNIVAQLNPAFHDYAASLQGGRVLATAEDRAKAAPQVLPLARKASGLLGQLAVAEAQAPDTVADLQDSITQIQVMQVVFGDQEVTADIAGAATGSGPPAPVAEAVQAVARYLTAADDAGRTQAMDDYGRALYASPNDHKIFSLIDSFFLVKPSLPLMQHLLTVLQTNSTSPAVQQFTDMLGSEVKIRGLLGKPIAISGVDLDGKPFTTSQWKGKVVLVDFWATWCPGCLAELPDLQQIVEHYHSQGLEIVGVSNDYDLPTLQNFLATHHMPWPQLFDSSAAGAQQWNPITLNLGIHGIPRTFVIDKKGILRNVDASPDLETLIPQLLAEEK